MRLLLVLAFAFVLLAATPVQGFEQFTHKVHEFLGKHREKVFHHQKDWVSKMNNKSLTEGMDGLRQIDEQVKRLRGSAGDATKVAAPAAGNNAVAEAVGSVRRMLFNAFRSYEKVPMSEKPPQYSRAGKINRNINEYLSRDQKKMKAYRHGEASPPQDQFDGSWSGYKQYAELKALRGASAAATPGQE